MNEASARDVTLLEAFETAQPASASWSADDRAWADRVALEAAGSEATSDEFIVQRARHALQRLLPRERLAARWLALPLWQARWIAIVALLAFVIGIAADSLGHALFGGEQRINLLAPPLWDVLLWNAAVYLVLAGDALAGLLRRHDIGPGPLVRTMRSLLRVRRRQPRAAAGGSGPALRSFGKLWAARSGRLATLRTETVLHAGAAALALGLIAGMYLRGLVFDYRAVWESTFLSNETAHALVSAVLAPASMLSGIALPDLDGFAALRAVHGEAKAGAGAAPWIHLLALTLLLFIVLPRVLLASLCAARTAFRAGRFPMPLSEPYFQRLARLQRGGAAHLQVWPYAHTPTPQATLALRALLAEAFGARVGLTIATTVAYGAENEAALAVDPATTHGLVLFDLNATPEAENHGRFIERLAAALPGGAAVAVLIDEAAFRQRFGALAERIVQRQQAWRACCEAVGAAAVFVDLDAAATPARFEADLRAAFVAQNAVHARIASAG
ncbi:MAG TPA: DUF2868 domain-containing protein [Burkholderiaceae bacterium]